MHKDSKLRIMTNVGKNRLVKVIFTNIHKITDACANSFGRYIMYEKYFYLSSNSNLFGKMVFLTKLKLIYPSTLQNDNNCSVPTFLILFKNILAPNPFKKEGRDYAFYTRDYKRETMKLLSFYMTDFLFTEL